MYQIEDNKKKEFVSKQNFLNFNNDIELASFHRFCHVNRLDCSF